MKQQRLVSSKLLDRKWKSKDHQIHINKLRTVKSAVRNFQEPPRLPNTTVRNAKRDAMMENRYTEIERENRILLEKMSNIMQSTKPNLYNPQRVEKRSLNREARKRESMKITIENQAILRRLQDKQATYSVTRWEEDHKNMCRIRDNVCEFPYEFGDGNSKHRQMLSTAQEGGLVQHDLRSGQGDQVSLPNIPGTASGNRGSRGYNTLQPDQRGLSAQPQSKRPVIRQAEALDENRIVLYKRSKQLGQGYYIVEISSNNSHLFIAAYDIESPESFLIELPERRAQDILTEFTNDYEKMASSLQVMNKRLVLLNPKFVQQKRLQTSQGTRGARVSNQMRSSGNYNMQSEQMIQQKQEYDQNQVQDQDDQQNQEQQVYEQQMQDNSNMHQNDGDNQIQNIAIDPSSQQNESITQHESAQIDQEQQQE